MQFEILLLERWTALQIVWEKNDPVEKVIKLAARKFDFRRLDSFANSLTSKKK
jgi:hypothetical protein